MRPDLHLSEDLRKHLHPRRSLPGTAAPMSEATARRALLKIRHEVVERARFGRAKGEQAAIYRAGTAKAAPELRELHARALAFIVDPSLEALRDADIETLAAAEILLQRAAPEIDFLGVVSALRGLLDGVRALHRASLYGLTAASGGWTTAVWLTHSAADARYSSRWLPVRHAVCASGDDAYAEAVALAHGLREASGDGSELLRRARLAYVFPDEPWANADLVDSHAGGAASCGFLLSAASEVAAVAAEVQRAPHALATYAVDLVCALPAPDMIALCASALPRLLQRPKYGPLLKTPPRQVAQALACLRTPEAAAALAPYAAHPVLQPIVLGFFRDAPELADVALQGKGAAAVQRVVAKRAERRVPEAEEGEAPAVLRERPWRARGKARARVEIVPEVAMLGLEGGRVVLPGGVSPTASLGGHAPREMSAAELAAWRAETEAAMDKGSYACADLGLVRTAPGRLEYVRVPDADCLAAWNSGKASLRGSPLELLARHGLAALPGLMRYDWLPWLGDYDGGENYLHAAMCVQSPAVAPRLARVAARRKRYRRVALAWLTEHAEQTAMGLIPDAVGPLGEARDDAEAGLLYLVSRGQSPVVRAAAGRYPIPVAEAVERLLARDPLALDVAPPKRPAFLRPDELPQITLRAGGALDAEARDALVELLQVSPLDPPYAGLAEVRAACAPESLAALAIELLDQWVLGDAPGRHEWMLFAAVHLPSEAGARRVAGLAREWASKSQEKAKRACVALAALGSDLALMMLAQIADTTRFAALKQHASALVLEAAEARGLSPDELADRTLPDAGLTPEGTLALSYGARSFTVTLDETLRPLVFALDSAGARVPGSPGARSLPRPNKADDPQAVEVARARFDLLRADLEAVADRERRRLERAMATGRAWSVAEFRARVVGHPLRVHLARRLVWSAAGVGPGGAGTTDAAARLFRVAEDGSLADAHDARYDAPEAAQVCVAHPAELAPDALAAWAQIFADYEILQPFEQLGRATFARKAHEREATSLDRCAGIVVAARKTLGLLESRGFRRESAGHVVAYVRPARATDGSELLARLPLTPGFEIEGLAHAPDQTTGAVTLTNAAGEPTPLGALHPVSFSELVRDALALAL